jgi:hypothetical protein
VDGAFLVELGAFGRTTGLSLSVSFLVFLRVFYLRVGLLRGRVYF